MILHHVGIVVKNLEKAIDKYQKSFNTVSSLTVYDDIQKSKLALVSIGTEIVELIEPASNDSPVANFLKKINGGIHHLCFETEDIQSDIKAFREKGALIVCKPVPAILFNGRKVCFLYFGDGLLIELLEADK